MAKQTKVKTATSTNSTYSRDGSKAGQYNVSYKPPTYKDNYKATEYSYDPFTPSEEYNSLVNQRNNYQNTLNNYGSYNSQFGDVLSATRDKILNGEKFNYDFNTDALYQQYKDTYTKLGNEASMNAAANASALTGGYGSSYGATAAAQANQQYMARLNDVIPELASAAYQKYMNERQDLYNQYSVLENADNTAYGRWANDRDFTMNMLTYYENAGNNTYNRDLGGYNATLDALYRGDQLTEDSKQYANDSSFRVQQANDSALQAYENALYNAWNGNENALANTSKFDESVYEFDDQMGLEREKFAFEKQKYADALAAAAARAAAGGGSRSSGSGDEKQKQTSPSGVNSVMGTDANGNRVMYNYDANGNLLNDPNIGMTNSAHQSSATATEAPKDRSELTDALRKLGFPV